MTRALLTGLILLALAPAAAIAQDPPDCFDKEERQTMVERGQVVTLSAALRAARARRGEVVKASLCRSPNGPLYLLTLLARDGKVTRAAVNARTGKLAAGR